MVTAGGLEVPSESSLWGLETMRGLMLLKMVMMRMLIGNMRRPLSIPTIISCQVICSDPNGKNNKHNKYKNGAYQTPNGTHTLCY